jgi:hypothetical protein
VIEKNKIRRGLSPRRAVESYQTQRDITIPAGTILRDDGEGNFAAGCGVYDEGINSRYVISIPPGARVPAMFKRVVA